MYVVLHVRCWPSLVGPLACRWLLLLPLLRLLLVVLLLMHVVLRRRVRTHV